MGSFLFKWDHPANEVYVTGSFDDWARSVKLERKEGHFEKLVDLPLVNDKIYYKFVVDGEWTTDHAAPQETDESNNVNNVLLPSNIVGQHTTSSPAATGIMSGVTPDSTSVGLAAKVPKESERGEKDLRPGSASSDMPPETPFHDVNEFALDPLPATSGIGNPVNTKPGDPVPDPENLTGNTIQSTVRDDPSLKESAKDSEPNFSVTPIPGTSGTGNPISLEPGEKVPHHSKFTSNQIDSNVTLDKDSYERAGGTGFVAPTNAGTTSRDIPSMPPVLGTMIPESSLPMGEGFGLSDPGVTVQSAGANSTTAALAAQVPLEPRGVPTVVAESQEEAGVDPEASGSREAVTGKSAVEKELESKVPEEPSTSEGTSSETAGGAADAEGLAAGGAAAGAAAASGSKGLPSSLQQSIDEINEGTSGTPIAPTVPDVVQESIAESHQSPEAAADKAKVSEKKAMETELLKEVPKEDDVGQPAPSSAAALTETAPSATGPESPTLEDNAPSNTATEPMEDSPPVTTAAAPAQTPAAQNAVKQAVQSEPDSRDISPMSKPVNPPQTQPTVTSGVGSSSAPQKSETPAAAASATKSSPASTSSAATDKKSKRSSGFFGKLKSKFSDKDKDKK